MNMKVILMIRFQMKIITMMIPEASVTVTAILLPGVPQPQTNGL